MIAPVTNASALYNVLTVLTRAVFLTYTFNIHFITSN